MTPRALELMQGHVRELEALVASAEPGSFGYETLEARLAEAQAGLAAERKKAQPH